VPGIIFVQPGSIAEDNAAALEAAALELLDTRKVRKQPSRDASVPCVWQCTQQQRVKVASGCTMRANLKPHKPISGCCLTQHNNCCGNNSSSKHTHSDRCLCMCSLMHPLRIHMHIRCSYAILMCTCQPSSQQQQLHPWQSLYSMCKIYSTAAVACMLHAVHPALNFA
jgi:hypothetical protein